MNRTEDHEFIRVTFSFENNNVLPQKKSKTLEESRMSILPMTLEVTLWLQRNGI